MEREAGPGGVVPGGILEYIHLRRLLPDAPDTELKMLLIHLHPFEVKPLMMRGNGPGAGTQERVKAAPAGRGDELHQLPDEGHRLNGGVPVAPAPVIPAGLAGR